MRIPQIVHILGQDFKIEFIKDSKKRNYVGRCYPNANKIELIENLPDDKLFQTYLHEVLHAIDMNLNMGLKHKHIDTLSVALYQFLKDNGYLSPTGNGE